ncbi:WYL domain-containing protein, partial [Salmonella enterica]|nr:WYL domain-containing protein [Salmonella enterica]
PEGFYADYLRDIVGVTKYAGLHAAEIVLRATDKKTFKYVETKKIHHSQETVKEFGKHDDGEYGEFRLTVVPNDEFYGRVLQWGAGLVVTSPESVREEIRSRVKRMARNYES